ncbi:hypothetical protein CVT25_003773, partial [Psilocybe cyanescens]
PSTTDDYLLDGLSPGDLYRYARTCKNAHEAVASFVRRHFHLHNLLRRYFKPDDIVAFRRLQCVTGMLISGSTALQFFERVIYPESDLDLYVEHHQRYIISEWLESIGYRYTPPATYPDETLEEALDLFPDERSEELFYETSQKGYPGVTIILNFEKSEPHRKIQLITTHHSTLQMVLNFHSSEILHLLRSFFTDTLTLAACVMNIITHEKAYSLYPRGTFDERRSLLYLPLRNDRRLLSAATKYAARGWQIVHKISKDESNNPRSAFSHGKRYLGDGKCWTLPIFPKLDFPPSNIEANSWALLYDADLVPNMASTVFTSPKLRYGYLIADEPLRNYISCLSIALDEKFEGEQYVGPSFMWYGY